MNNKNNREALKECSLKSNVDIPEKKQNEIKFQSIEVKSK